MPEKLSVLNHQDENILLTVEAPPRGFWCSIKLLARIPLPPEEVYDILVDPENYKIFRSVKEMRNRRVLWDNNHGKEEVEVEQVGQWKFGPFKGSFNVHLIVNQDKNKRTMNFRLAHDKIQRPYMKDFSGGWVVKSYNADNIEEMITFPGRHWGPLHNLKKAFHELEDTLTGKHANSSIVELKQCVAPGVTPPKALEGLLIKLTARQVRTIMEDLLNEADRRNKDKARVAKEEKNQREKDEKKALESHIRKI
ncbi:hypothetical protein Ndes2526B_g05890 [Nannochloris sp. 'desiccata']|nr:hypothetical protein KSW81_007699 [Chlorella desiccata (nom. nud.)]KAH7618944.1 hypothetical protein NADE_005792 [Chlorella desiccata (nom. nud.)]